MKILYDYQAFNLQNFGGISRHYVDLLEYFKEENLLDVDLSLKYSDNYYLHQSPYFKKLIEHGHDLKEEKFLFGIKFKGKGKIVKLLRKYSFSSALKNQKITISKLNEGKFDIFQPTYYDHYFLKYIGLKPYVVMVPDMIHEKFIEFYFGKPGWEVTIWKRNVVKNAKHIIAVSESTKNDIVNLLNVNPEKISVVYHASKLSNQASVRYKSNESLTDYILYVGHRAMYKNFYFYIQSIASILKKNNLKLVCAGGGNFGIEDKILFKELGIDRNVIYSEVSDEKLVELYKNALGFVYPSLSEGFGIPILEAFANSCIVLASDIKVFKEIGKDAPLFFNPKDPKSIRASLETLVSLNHNEKTKLIHSGLQRYNDFSIQKTAELTKKVYEKVLNG